MRHTYYTRKGQTANGVRDTVPICYSLWWKNKRKRHSLRLHEHSTEGQRHAATRKWE